MKFLLLLALLAAPAAASQDGRMIAFTGCRVIASWNAEPEERAIVMVRDGRIAAFTRRLEVPAEAQIVDCRGATLVPGFWNAHVHLLHPDFAAANSDPAAAATRLRHLFSKWGFVRVVDTGSDLAATRALAEQVSSGAIDGPGILTTGMPFVSKDGTPFYAEGLPFPELDDAASARAAARAALDAGAFGIKVMTVSLTRKQPWPAMEPGALAAVVGEAHSRSALVFAHPTNIEGVEAAIAARVDVLLHTAPLGGEWSTDLARRMVQAKMALVPTLKLWAWEAERDGDAVAGAGLGDVAAQQLAAFRAAGGTVLFGTDVGYMTDPDPSDEFLWMGKAGMSPRDVLRSLTEAPARALSAGRSSGRIAVGEPADLLILEGDPLTSFRALSNVRAAWREGKLLYFAD